MINQISVVVPLLNERQSLPFLHGELIEALGLLNMKWEIIYCDNDSSDGSFDFLKTLAISDERVKIIRLRKNFGQAAAMAAGFRHSSGDIIVALDADLQNVPSDIPGLVSKLHEGYDLVCGWRKNRKDPFWSVSLPSRIGNFIIRLVTGLKLHDIGCTLMAYRREIIDDIDLLGEMHRFIPVWADSAGAKIVEMPVSHRPRKYGRSKYGISKTPRVIMDLLTVRFITGYGTRPMHMFGFAGFFLFAVALVLMALSFSVPGAGLEGNSSLFPFAALIFLAAGFQVLLLGLFSELAIRVSPSSVKKVYSIREKVNFRTPEILR